MAQSDTFQAGWGGSVCEFAATGWDSLGRLADAAGPLGELAGCNCTTACPELELLAFDTGAFNLWRFGGGQATCSASSDPHEADPPEPAPGSRPPDTPVQHSVWSTGGGGGAKQGGAKLTGGDCTTALLAFELEELDAHAFGG